MLFSDKKLLFRQLEEYVSVSRYQDWLVMKASVRVILIILVKPANVDYPHQRLRPGYSHAPLLKRVL